MMAFLALILLIAALTMVSWVLFGLIEQFPLPAACPQCWLRSMDSRGVWYERDKTGLRCRACKSRFEEHSDGSIYPTKP